MIKALILITAFAGTSHTSAKKTEPKAKPAPTAPAVEAPFVVEDLPQDPAIEGLLGEPGSPSLAVEQGKLAEALLNRGLCDVSYYGEETCKKKSAALKNRFDVTDLRSKLIGDRDALGAVSE